MEVLKNQIGQITTQIILKQPTSYLIYLNHAEEDLTF